MDLVQIIKILIKYSWIILGISILMALVTLLMTYNKPDIYSSYSLINTGLVSGYNPESQNAGKVDYTFTTNEIENLINIATAYETIEELGAKLLAEYVNIIEADNKIISPDGLELLNNYIPDDLKTEIRGLGYDESYRKIILLRDRDRVNPVYKLLYSKNDFFGIEKLKTIRVERQNKSDMIKIQYSASDPGISKRTIELLTKIFVRKQKSIKEGQSTSVLDFFENATHDAADKLKNAEDQLLNFRINNNIINYYEQTRYISSKKEDLEVLYQSEIMKEAAADSTIKKLELQIGNRIELSDLNNELLASRKLLANLTTQLSVIEIMAADSTTNNNKIANLKERVEKLKDNIRKQAYSTYSFQITPAGLEMDNVLNHWLNSIIASEQTKARIEVIKGRRAEFHRIYNKFAPLGSILNRIEREIEVAEKEYLENLHSLNQTRLHKHSMLMSTNLKVVDKPFYPPKPLASKRLLYVVISFITGIVLMLSLLLVIEYFDNTLSNAKMAGEATGLNVLGVIPLYKAKKGIRDETLNLVYKRSKRKLWQNLKTVLIKKSHPLVINILSVRRKEGKSFVGYELSQLLLQLNRRTIFLTPQTDKNRYEANSNLFFYDITNYSSEMVSVSELLDMEKIDNSDVDYIFIEHPATIDQDYPIELLKNSDLNVMVTRANRVWKANEQKIVENILTGTNKELHLILNGCDIEQIEDQIGEIPKKRPFLRRRVKQILSMGFKAKYSLK